MKLLESPNFSPRHPEDIESMKSALAARGYQATAYDLEQAWDQYSERSGASWSPLPNDEESLASILLEHFDECAGYSHEPSYS